MFRSATGFHSRLPAILAGLPALLGLVLALSAPGWRSLFLGLLLLGAIMLQLWALPLALRLLGGWWGAVSGLCLVLSLLMPLVPGMLLLVATRLALLWLCRHWPQHVLSMLVPGFPLMDVALVAGAILAIVSA